MPKRLGEILVAKGFVTEADVDEALQAQVLFGGKLGTNLVELEKLDLDQLTQGLSLQSGLAPATAADFASITASTLALVSAKLAEKHRCLPLSVAKNARSAAIAVESANVGALDELAFTLGIRVQAKIAPELRIQHFLEKHYGIQRKNRYVRLNVSGESRAKGKTAAPAAQTFEVPPEMAEQHKARDELFGKTTGHLSATLTGEIPAQTFDWRAAERAGTLKAKGAADEETLELAEVVPEAELSARGAASRQRPPASSPARPSAPTEHVPSSSRQPVTSASGPRATASRGSSLPSAAPHGAPPVSTPGESPHAAAASGAVPGATPDTTPGGAAPYAGSRGASLPSAVPHVSTPGGSPYAPSVAGAAPLAASAATLDTSAAPYAASPVSAVPSMSPHAAPAGASGADAAPGAVTLGDTSESSATEEVFLSADAATPVDLSFLSTRIAAANEREEIADTILDYLRASFDYGLVLMVRQDMILGWRGFAREVDEAVLETLALPLSAPTFLHLAAMKKGVYRGPAPEEGAAVQNRFFKLLRCDPPAELLVAPIVIRDRVVSLIYAHSLQGRIPESAVADLATLALHASTGFVRLIQKARSGS